ncbi:MAG: T9SS type A sorting domain-containing protein [Bacteroidales bacterium]|nr:T9SS type A sorting domain-containing protein [Bacteroidales bacterium]
MKILFRFLLIFAALAAWSQSLAQNHEALPEPAMVWRCTVGDTAFNHNPAMMLGGDSVIVFDSLPYASDYTVIAVYKPAYATETVIWNLDFGGGVLNGLTSETVVSGGVPVRYADSTSVEPAIGTLRQSAPDSVSPHVRLTVGGGSALKVAEIRYYTARIGTRTLRRLQGALAVRYGVTLGPVDYLDSRGVCIREYADSGLYRHRVTGLGSDSAAGVCQTRSRSEHTGSVIAMEGGTLPEGAFVTAGDDDGELSFSHDGFAHMLGREWKTVSSVPDSTRFTLVFDTRDFTTRSDSMVLLVGAVPYPPYSVSAERVEYRGVSFPTGVSRFTLGYGDDLWRVATEGGRSKVSEEGAGMAAGATVYPNPTSGDYTVEVAAAGRVRVTVYNIHGAVVAVHGGDSEGVCRFNGELPSGGVYFAEVETGNGSQTIKIVVK